MIKLTNENINEYNSEIENYIENELEYRDNTTVDSIKIEWDKIIVEGCFRYEEPEDWDEYEQAWFPDDVHLLELDLKEIEDYLN